MSNGERPFVRLALCLGLIVGLLTVRIITRAAPERVSPAAQGAAPAQPRLMPAEVLATTSYIEEHLSAPRHLLLRVRGLRVSDRPIGQPSLVSDSLNEYVEAELLLETRVANQPDGAVAYSITSSLIDGRDGNVRWAQTYNGVVHDWRALRLQVDRALHDALIHTLMGRNSRLMVEKIEPGQGSG